MGEKNKQATILLLIGTIFWGMTFVFIKEGVSIINVYSFLSFRFIIAGIILGLIFIHKFKHFNFKLLKYGLLLAIPLGIAFITQTIGLQFTSASKGGFITGLSVVFVPIFLTCINKKIPRWNHILSVIIATIGLALLTTSSSFGVNVGDIWVFICAVSFAIYIIMVGRITKHFDSILLTFVQLISIGIVTGIIALFLGELTIPKGYLVWQAIVFTAIFATAFMYTIQNHFQKYISEVKAGIIFSFEPLFAAITAYFYLSEQLTLKIIIGGLLIFIGMVVSELKIKKS